MSYYYTKTVERVVSLLIKKQYPECDMVLDDDVIIVLTNVDISCTNNPGESDDSDDDSELAQFMNEDDFKYVNIDEEKIAMEDFIDDRPEDELSEHSNSSENESGDEGQEDKEYDSSPEEECVIENDSDPDENQSQHGSEPLSENENENNENSEENDENDDDGEDSDDETITPSKTRKTNNKIDDSSSESEDNFVHRKKLNFDTNPRNDDSQHSCDSQEGRSDMSDVSNVSDVSEESDESDECDDDKLASPPKKFKLAFSRQESSSDSSNDGYEEDLTGQNGSTFPTPISNNNNVHQRHTNKFGVFLVPKIDKKRTLIRYHGRIGMEGIKGICKPMEKAKFCDLINYKRNRYGFTRLNLMYVNGRHLENRKKESELEKPVRKLLIHLIDQWFPLGIPEIIHLNRAIDLLECMKKKIAEGKILKMKYSNKFYALIPHQGDNRRRQRFKTIEHCDNKITYVKKMISAIKCLNEVEFKRNTNPLDYFIEKWVKIELKSIEITDDVYTILKKAVDNTQHINSERRFGVENIFQVDNMNPNTNGDFSTNITLNHRYLFHFTFPSNLLCILREGLQSAPRQIHSVSQFFGKGIYFWDAIANAGLNYKSLNTIYLLVCRVALGNSVEVEQQYLKHGQMFPWEPGMDSIFCAGQKYASSRDAEEDLKGAKIYCGQFDKESDNFFINKNDLYNKYVIRNKQQVNVEYIIKLKKVENDEE